MIYLTVLRKGRSYTKFEINKIELLEKNGINVPKIVYKSDDYYIMESVGEGLADYIENHKYEEKKLVKRAFEAMISLHKKGFAHGGAQIRNYTIKHNKIFIIDFEEDVTRKYKHFFQIRDIMRFLLSLENYKFEYNLQEVLDYYENEMNNYTIKRHLKKFFLKYKWVNFLNSSIFNSIRMKDIRNYLRLMQKMENLTI